MLVDTWRSDWPVHIKRARIAAAIEIQRCKGSGKSVRDVVRSCGGDVLITAVPCTTLPEATNDQRQPLERSGRRDSTDAPLQQQQSTCTTAAGWLHILCGHRGVSGTRPRE
ncbi:hypothetical protein AF72_04215 [Xylella taiwanensis]|uniref:Uncharacterized protein n=1 Tax=Xylella taiwanensis TaxID=1444770 RepID=Z9JLY8_9GAMM|nr:hypothetical protein AF72_04215 [Xylella taiwanensis]